MLRNVGDYLVSSRICFLIDIPNNYRTTVPQNNSNVMEERVLYLPPYVPFNPSNRSDGITLNNKMVGSQDPLSIRDSYSSTTKLYPKNCRLIEMTPPSHYQTQTNTMCDKTSTAYAISDAAIEVDLDISSRWGFPGYKHLSGRYWSKVKAPGLYGSRCHLNNLHSMYTGTLQTNPHGASLRIKDQAIPR